MRAILVELECDPVVFEIRGAGKAATKDVVLHVYGLEDASKLAVRPQSIPPAGAFRFAADKAEVKRHSDDPSEPIHVSLPVTCEGGEDGKEGESSLTLVLEYEGEQPETCSVRLIGSANHVLPAWKILAEEYAEIRPAWSEEIRGNAVLNDPNASDGAKLKEMLAIANGHSKRGDGLTALCFSGGGIRSATFNLGLLQRLAAAGLLDKFDYVSSVSGGGYLSSWLAGWLHRGGGVEAVAPQLGELQADPQKPEPGPLLFLRQYSNYLTPRLGALSGDTWTVASIVIRNLLLNLLVMVPLLAAALALPLLAVAKAPAGWSPGAVPLFWLAAITGTTGLFFMSLLRASAKPRPGKETKGWEQRFLLLGLAPLLLGNVLMAWGVAEFEAHGGLVFSVALRWSAIWALVLPVVAFAAASLLQGRLLHRERSFLKGDLISLALSGAVISFLYAAVVARWAGPLLHSKYPFYPALAPILFLGPLMLHKTLFVAFSSVAEERGLPSDLGDADREWWARWSGYTLIAAVLWMVVSAIVFFGPTLLGMAKNAIGSRITTAGVTGVLGWIISRLGRSSSSSAKETGGSAGWREWVLAMAAPLFALATLLLVSSLTQDLLRAIFDVKTDYTKQWIPPFTGTIWQVLGASLALAAVGIFMGRFVNVNRFSLQAMYRNRLVRAYLGASNPRRRPNLFTGFDPEDNLRLHELRDNRPFPVISTSLNLVAGKDLAWQQRKAECFTASPLHCGAARLGYRRAQAFGGEKGISLGTAVATSGAAANPNMGYHSSPAVTFIMTLFNARLGVWLGNPAPLGVNSYTRSGPRSSGLTLLAEALGMTDSEHPYVNLSDGGHFENLGIYEMVRRRCRYIVVGDAGGDPTCTFEDLGNAIRKIRIDLGIPIEFTNRIDIYPKPAGKPETDARYCAVGTIRYAAVDGAQAQPGTLIYIKPAIYGGRDEPYDVYNYSRTSKDFPHESTADQWFSESQFESYRALGWGIVQSLIGQGPHDRLQNLPDFEDNVRAYLHIGSSRPEREALGEPALAAPALPPPIPEPPLDAPVS